MELLHNLWNVLTTEDENLIRYIMPFVGIIETYVIMKLFTTILNINYTKKQRNLYFVITFFLTVLNNFINFNFFNIAVVLIIMPIVIKVIFKTSIIKSFLAEIIPMIVIVIFESIYLKLCFILLGITPFQCKAIIIYRIPFTLLIYLTIFLLSVIIKHLKRSKDVLDNMSVKQKRLIILNLIFVVLIIALQFYLFIFYNNTLPLYITIISLLSMLTYSIVSIYSIVKTANLEITKRELEQVQLHNKTLELLYNNYSAFRHDFSNILTAFGGYIYADNLDGLKTYYKQILDECHINNNLSALNPKVINNPAVYNIMATKYYKADELGIKINLQVFINLNELKLDIYDFCRILGILLDNAIEAASKCEEKEINIDIHNIKQQKYQVLTIENTYQDKNLEISKLSEKGYTTKKDEKGKHGIGLWQVSRIVKKHKNLILDTTKDDKYFRQELLIYYK